MKDPPFSGFFYKLPAISVVAVRYAVIGRDVNKKGHQQGDLLGLLIRYISLIYGLLIFFHSIPEMKIIKICSIS